MDEHGAVDKGGTNELVEHLKSHSQVAVAFVLKRESLKTAEWLDHAALLAAVAAAEAILLVGVEILLESVTPN